MQLTVPTAIAAILPLLATILSSWLNDDHFRPGVNAVIALVAILFTAVLCEWLAGGFIPGNPTASFLAILGYVGVLMAGDFSVLYQYLIAKQSPLSTALGPPAAPANANPVRIPTGIPLPPNVPPRASAPPQDQPPGA